MPWKVSFVRAPRHSRCPPLKISNDLLWGGYGYFLKLHNNSAITLQENLLIKFLLTNNIGFIPIKHVHHYLVFKLMDLHLLFDKSESAH